MNDYFAEIISFLIEEGEGDLLHFNGYTNPILERRKRALMRWLEKPSEELKEYGISGYEDLFVTYESELTANYELLDDEKHFIYGAAIWILDELKRNKTIWKAFRYLPEDDSVLWDEIDVPWDIYDTEYDMDLILSVVYVLMKRNDDRNFVYADERTAGRPENYGTLQKSKNRQNFEGLMALLDKTRVQDACRHFEEAHKDALKRYMDCARIYYEKETILRDQVTKIRNAGLLSADIQKTAQKAIDVMEEIKSNQHELQVFSVAFPDMLSLEEQEIRKKTESRKLTKILSGYRIEDPFELCFALFALIDQGSDIPWLFGSCSAVMNAAGAMLPWYHTEYDDDWFDEEDIEEERADNSGTEIVQKEYRRKAKGIPEPIDFYHTKYPFRGGQWNLAQILFDISRGIPLRGTHPFEDVRKELLDSGMEEQLVSFIITLAETVESAAFKKEADNLRGDNAAWKVMERYDNGENPAGTPKRVSFEDLPDEIPDTEAEDNADDDLPDDAEEEKPEDTIRRLRQENKNLRKVLSENNAEFSRRLGKAELELKALRREHRELSDLRTILFNQENETEEQQKDSGISFPYTTAKRTVVFGGHESFLKVIRPMLPEVRFVDPSNLSFDGLLLRNTEVIWIQNNCISHSQYWRAINYARQHGIQVRYFAYASAEKCAEQLAVEDGRGANKNA